MTYRSKDKNGIPRHGRQVDELLTKIEDLTTATTDTDGLLSAEDKQKLDTLDNDEELTIDELETILT